MHHRLDALQRRGQRLALERPSHRHDVVAAPGQMRDHMAADKSGRSGDRDFHESGFS
jgi:hypothetical protein